MCVVTCFSWFPGLSRDHFFVLSGLFFVLSFEPRALYTLPLNNLPISFVFIFSV